MNILGDIKRLFNRWLHKGPLRFWDFSTALKVFSDYGDKLEYMALELYGNAYIMPEVFIEDGITVQGFHGQWQMFHTPVDDILYTRHEIPCLHLIYKGGNEEFLACYIDSNGIETHAFSHRRLKIPAPCTDTLPSLL